jgi:Ca2+-binding RTX toxin-like protein
MSGNEVNHEAIGNIASSIYAFWDGTAQGINYAGWGRYVGPVSNVGLAFSAGFGLYSTVRTFQKDGPMAGLKEGVSQTGSTLTGGYGAMVGGAIGAELFGIGAVPGAVIGGIIGSLIGGRLNNIAGAITDAMKGQGFAHEGFHLGSARVSGSYPGEYGEMNANDVISENDYRQGNSPGYTSALQTTTTTPATPTGSTPTTNNGDATHTYQGQGWLSGDTPKETNLAGMNKPVVIDLSPSGSSETKDGLQFFTLWNSAVFFNSDEDGYRERTAWVGPDEGIVVHDTGTQNTVSSYEEVALSGSAEAIAAGATTDMDALLKLYDTGYDKNKNGKIDADEGKGDKIITSDEAYANNLKIWRDADMDGQVDQGEMVLFEERTVNGVLLQGAGIKEIDLTDFQSPILDADNDGKKDPTILQRFSDGSTIYNTATVKMTNGSTTTAYDMGFAHENVGIDERMSGDVVTSVRLERNIGIASTKWLYKAADVDGAAVNWNFDSADLDAYYGGTGTNGNDKMSFTGSQRRSFAGGAGNDSLSGGKGDDFLVGETGKDKLSGGAGNDVLYVDADDLTVDGAIDGGEGFDVVRVNSPAAVVLDLKETNTEAFFGNDGNDNVHAASDLDGVIESGGGGNDYLYGGSGDDTIIGGEGADRLSGGSGNDTLIGGDGADRLFGGNGDDLIYADENDDFTEITGGDGFDVLVIDDSADKTHVFTTVLNLIDLGFEAAVGGDGNDVFKVNTTEDTFLYGAGGNDTLTTGSGDDLIAGGKGNDTLDGNGGSDLYLFNRGDGDDKISEGIVVSTDGNGGVDTIGFGSDIDVDDLQFARTGSDLIISLRTENKTTLSGETIRIYGWSGAANQVETLAFSDGTILDIGGASFTALGTGDDSNVDQDVGTSTIDSVGASTRLNVIDAGEGDDTIYTWAGNDIVLGRAGNDEIHGGDGHDYLDGGFGGDTLYGDAGDDTLIGGKDSNATDKLYGGSGNDTLDAGGGNDTLLGESGFDILIGGDGNNTLDGGTSDDQLFGGKGTDILKGGTGDDMYFVSRGDGADTITDIGSDDDNGSIRYSANPFGPDRVGDWVVFGSGITMDDLTFDVVGGALIIGIGEDGDLAKRPIDLADHITVTGWTESENRLERFLFSDGFSLDVVDDMSGVNTGTNGTNSLSDGDGDHLMSGGAGNDMISGGDGTDVIIGGAGNDSLSGGNNEDYLFGGSGNDTMNGGDGSDRLFGGAGNDTIAGGGGSDNDVGRVDYLVGGGGDDTLIGGSSTDIYAFDYGEGTDTIQDSGGINTIELANGIWFSDINFTYDGEKLVLDLDPLYRPDIAGTTVKFERYTIDQVAFSNGFFVHIDHLTGGSVGTENDDVFNNATNSGGHWLAGKDGADKIYAGSGDDYLYGGRHDDILSGGDGDDTYIINARDGKDTITEAEGDNDERDSIAFGPAVGLTDLILRREGDDMYIAIRDSMTKDLDPKTAESYIKVMDWADSHHRIDWFEFADGTALNVSKITTAKYYGAGDDPGTGGDSAEWFDAGSGNDVIDALGGNDIMFGRDGDDNLQGGSGDDTIYGDKGKDRLYGESGNDTLIGGEGDDYLSGSSGHNRVFGGEGKDTLISGSGSSLVAGGEGDDVIYRGGFAKGEEHRETVLDGSVNGTDRYKTIITWDDSDLKGGARITNDHTAVTVVQFAAGDGKDHLIVNSDKNLGSGQKDQIDLVGISSKEVWFQHVGNDLVLKILGTEDQLTFDDYYLGSDYGFDRINANGEYLTSDRIAALVDVMDNYTDVNDGTDGTGISASELPSTVVSQIGTQWEWITA